MWADRPPIGETVDRRDGNTLISDYSKTPTACGAPAKCPDVSAASTTPGRQLEIWDCKGGAHQIFTRTSSGQLTVYSGAGQLCPDAYNAQTVPGAKAQTWTCTRGADQQRSLNSGGTITGVQSGLCLDVTGASTASRALIELWTGNGGSNQQWQLG